MKLLYKSPETRIRKQSVNWSELDSKVIQSNPFLVERLFYVDLLKYYAEFELKQRKEL